MIEYIPRHAETPSKLLDVPTGWRPCETILADIIERFNVAPRLAIEFGVEYGFSTSALASYFDTVIAVDHFKGDEHSGGKDIYGETFERLIRFRNVALERFGYREWIEGAGNIHADLIHVDIRHTYRDTYTLGQWAADHAEVVLFHDTLSFCGVRVAVERIAYETGRRFYNHENINGLGILSRREPL